MGLENGCEALLGSVLYDGLYNKSVGQSTVPVGDHESGSIQAEEDVGCGACFDAAAREAGRAVLMQDQQRHLSLGCLPQTPTIGLLRFLWSGLSCQL